MGRFSQTILDMVDRVHRKGSETDVDKISVHVTITEHITPLSCVHYRRGFRYKKKTDPKPRPFSGICYVKEGALYKQ